ncbi:MAG TPA: DHH family phosphoesterase, partial [Candidatus Binatia bacterium]|nr:DHH family phosphoesterase [Candidatus Binatia bacterium]
MPDTFKQVAEKFHNSGSVLIVISPMPAADTIAAALALSGFLKRIDKDAVIITPDGHLNTNASFLPGYDQILREFNASKGFVIDVSTKRTGVAELSYKKEGDKISVYLKPKAGQFEPNDVTFRNSKYPYDAIITIGVSKLENLGEFFGRYAEMFYETPIVNIDFKGSNEGFGQFNLVELNASSNSEIVFDLISEMEKDLIDQEIATTLLAGIIVETNSFQHTRTTPQAFTKAAELVGLGGDQQKIVVELYKNKSMGFLKLWGRVLARLKEQPESSMVYSSVNRLDVEKAGANDADASLVLKEMVLQLSFAKIHIFFRELHEDSTEVYISAPAVLNL